MSKQFVEFDNGVMVEIDIDKSEIEAISGGDDMVNKVDKSMKNVKGLLLKSVEPIVEAYEVLNQDVVLEKAEVEIGIGFSAEGNVFVAKGKASTNLKIKLILSPKA